MDPIRDQLTVSDIMLSLSTTSPIYEIRGTSAYFGYTMGGSSLFVDKGFQTKAEGIGDDYSRVLHAIFRCADIMTINPRSIWLKCRFGESAKIIQVVDIGSTGIPLTRKKCMDFLDKIEDIQYGHFHIIKNPGTFLYRHKDQDYDKKEFTELFPNLDIRISDLSSDFKKKLFQKLEKILLLNGKSKIKNWDILNCRSILVSTPYGDLRIFRSR